MKKWCIFFLFLSIWSFAKSPTPIGKIKTIQGTSFSHTKDNKKQLLKINDPVYTNMLIETAANCEVLILFNNGKYHLVLENSKLLISTSTNSTGDKTMEALKKMLTVGSIKAAQDEEWLEEIDEIVKKMQTAFSVHDFYRTLQIARQYKGNATHKDFLFFQAVSYLQLSLYEKAALTFSKLSTLGSKDYEQLSQLGLFLSYFLKGDKEKAYLYSKKLSLASTLQGKIGVLFENQK